MTKSNEILLTATTGLLRFRRGDPDNGREWYMKAIQLAREAKDPVLQARAAMFLAQEEVRARTTAIQEAVTRALSYAASVTYPDLELQVNRLNALLTKDTR